MRHLPSAVTYLLATTICQALLAAGASAVNDHVTLSTGVPPRTSTSGPVLARTVAGVHERLAGTAPDPGWSPPAGVDLSCRFRSAPHLL